MRYFSVRLFQNTGTSTDILGNPVTSPEIFGCRYVGRFTEWTAEEKALEGREVTQTQRKMLTDAPLDDCKRADGVRAGAEDYRVKNVKDLHGRWRLLYLERWRQK